MLVQRKLKPLKYSSPKRADQLKDLESIIEEEKVESKTDKELIKQALEGFQALKFPKKSFKVFNIDQNSEPMHEVSKSVMFDPLGHRSSKSPSKIRPRHKPKRLNLTHTKVSLPLTLKDSKKPKTSLKKHKTK